MNPIHVTYIIDHLRIGGAQAVLKNIVENLPSKYAGSIINLRADTQLAQELKAGGAEVRSLDIPKYSLSAGRRLRGEIGKREPAIVHTNLDFSNVFGARAAEALGVPIVIRHDHSGCTSHGRKYYFRRFLTEKLVSKDNRIIAVAEDVKSFNVAIGIDPDRVIVIHNGVDIDRFKQTVEPFDLKAGPAPIVGFVGRLHEQKGLRYLVEAAPEILETAPEAKFAIVGDGPERKNIERLVKDAGLAGSFIFLGYQTEPEKFYAAFDVVVVPSIFEPFGLCAAEAMAMKKPVIAFDSDGLKEVITNGINGYLVPARDSRALAEKVGLLLSDGKLAKEIGQRAAEHIRETYSARTAADKVYDLYGSLLEQSGFQR